MTALVPMAPYPRASSLTGSPGYYSQPLSEGLTGSRDLSDGNAAKSGGYFALQ